MTQLIDSFYQNHAKIDGKYWVARPLNYKLRSVRQRIKEAWGVFTGKYEAVKFYKQ